MFQLFFLITQLLNEVWSEQIVYISLMTTGSWRATGGMLFFFYTSGETGFPPFHRFSNLALPLALSSTWRHIVRLDFIKE